MNQLLPVSPMGLIEVVLRCSEDDEFVSEFNRLTESKLGQSASRSAFEIAIDKACGASGESADDMMRFVVFVYETVRLRVDWSRSEGTNG